MKKVSLILTTYNSKENLIQTLESIKKQDYPKLEVVIKDGKSTDGTVAVVKEYAREGQLDIVWKSAKDTGIYDAMNQGFELSDGELVIFFNDCFIDEKAISKLVAAMGTNEKKYQGAHADLIYSEKQKIVRYWHMGTGILEQGWMPGHPTLILKREVYEEFGLYDTSYVCSADYEFMVRMLKGGKIQLSYVPEILVNMFYGGKSNNGLKNYLISLKEGHRALKENGVKCAWLIDIKRTYRVLIQFVKKPRQSNKLVRKEVS